MDKISGLPDELLVKILFLVPTKVAVSTSSLSKRWESLWKLVPKLEGDCSKPVLWDFIVKNLPLRAPIIESLCLDCCPESLFQLVDIKEWVGIAVSRCLRELSINKSSNGDEKLEPDVVFPSSLYTCKLLVTLKLEGSSILLDVPLMVCLPSLKTLQLLFVTYSNEDSLRLLLSGCHVLEELVIERDLEDKDDNMTAMVIIVPSLQRLSLVIDNQYSPHSLVIYTPSLKYFKMDNVFDSFDYLIEHMPELEEAKIYTIDMQMTLLKSVTSVKRLTLCTQLNVDGFLSSARVGEQSEYRDGIVFDRLEQLKGHYYAEYETEDYCWYLRSSDPECLKKSLETFEFEGYMGKLEEREFLSFIFKKARCLKSTTISRDKFHKRNVSLTLV